MANAKVSFRPTRVAIVHHKLFGDTMSLDTSTLYAVAAMIAALLGMMLLFFGLQEKIAALKWW